MKEKMPMNTEQIQHEISIIKEMISKSRSEAAESGHFFVGIGLLGVIATPLIGLLESIHLDRLILPLFVLMTFISAAIGFLTVGRQAKKEKVKSYAKTLCYQILFACSIPALLIVFVFPLLRVYPWNLVPVLTSLIMGIMVYSAGTIYEIRSIRWCGVFWWAGAVLMALFAGHQWIRISIMNLSLFVGFVLPGLILNRKYKKGKSRNGS
jgi:hypothetical protein